MTPEFDAMFKRLCERWPEKYKHEERNGYHLFNLSGLLYGVTEDRYLWFLHKLAESLGGVVWASPNLNIPSDKPLGWEAFWWNGNRIEFCRQHDTQTLALESAVVGLIEAKLNEKEK